MSRVISMPVPPRARELAGLDRVDYADAFAVDVPVRRTPRAWIHLSATAMPTLFSAVRQVHRALGLRLAPTDSADHPIGWDILRDDPEEAVLGNHGFLGTARIVGLTPPGQIAIVTLIQLNGIRGRALWTAVAPGHRAVARYVLNKMPALGGATSDVAAPL